MSASEICHHHALELLLLKLLLVEQVPKVPSEKRPYPHVSQVVPLAPSQLVLELEVQEIWVP